MVRSCSVFGCHNKDVKGNGLRFFRLPHVVTKSDEATQKLSERRRREWLAAICRRDMNPQTCLVCSVHFISGEVLNISFIIKVPMLTLASVQFSTLQLLWKVCSVQSSATTFKSSVCSVQNSLKAV